MLVDPFTVVAQVVNFLVLVVALKLLLYDRVIAAMDARQRGIAERIARAERLEEEAARTAEHHDRELTLLLEERAQRLQDAEQEAAERRDELVTEARRGVADLEERWLDALHRERARLLEEVREEAADRVLRVARLVLADLADEELEDRIIDVFVDRLATVGGDQLRDMDGGRVEVRTGFELGDRRRHHLERALRPHVGRDREVRFVHDPELLGGVELDVDGHALGWNIDAYLDEVEAALHELLRTEVGRP